MFVKIIVVFLVITRINGYSPSKDLTINRIENNASNRENLIVWSNGIVPYEIESDFESRESSLIISTMEKMERLIATTNGRCIHFRPRISSDQYYLTIRSGSDCSSYVVRDSKHIVTFESSKCVVERIIIYELLQTLGIKHNSIEQKYGMDPTEIKNLQLFYNCSSKTDTLPAAAAAASFSLVNLYNVNTTVSSSLNTNSLMYVRPGSFSRDYYYYESYKIQVPFDSNYTIWSNSSIDTYGFLYKTYFDVNNTYVNLMKHDGNGSGLNQFQFTAYLLANTTYVVVFTTHRPFVIGSYQLIVSSLYSVQIQKLNNVSVRTTTFSSILTSDSSIFTRYGTTGIYYYKSILITVNTNGNYSIQSNSSINTYGYLYLNTFDPQTTLRNLLTFNDDAAGSGQFLMTYQLQSNNSYVLVVTTYTSYLTGSFSIQVSGPSMVNLTSINNRYIINTTISSLLTSSSATYSPPFSYNQYQHYYESYQINVFYNDYYTIKIDKSIKSCGYLYNTGFNPYFPNDNLLIYDCLTDETNQFQYSAYLRANETYILVVAAYWALDTGYYRLVISGFNPVQVIKLYSIYIRTATYSSILTYDSLTFTPYRSSGIHYYKSILITVSTSGNYTIQSNSSIDTYGYLYLNTFDPQTTSRNLLTFNDDAAGSGQFLMTYQLQSYNTYVLVITTYTSYSTGSFSIQVSGPSAARLTGVNQLVSTTTHKYTTTSAAVQNHNFGIMFLITYAYFYL